MTLEWQWLLLLYAYLLQTASKNTHEYIVLIKCIFRKKKKDELKKIRDALLVGGNVASGNSVRWMVKNMKNAAVNLNVSMTSVITGGGMWSLVWFDLTNTANVHWQAKHTRRAERQAPGWGEGQGCSSNTVNPTAAEELKTSYMQQSAFTGWDCAHDTNTLENGQMVSFPTW